MKADRSERLFDLYQTGPTSAELEELLRTDKGQRQLFVELSLLEIHLHKVYSKVLPLGDGSKRPARLARRYPVWIAIAALVALAVAGVILSFSRRDDTVPISQATASEVVNGQIRVDGVNVTRIPTNARFEVVGDQVAMIRLADGSRLELKPSTKASIRGQQGDARQVIDLSAGSGTFHVMKGDGKFRVDTPVGTVTALGTAFTTELRSDSKKRAGVKKNLALAVSVMEGTVQVDANGKRMVMQAGESRVFEGDGQHNQNDDGQKNQNDDGQKNQNDDGQKNQNDDGQKNQNDNGR